MANIRSSFVTSSMRCRWRAFSGCIFTNRGQNEKEWTRRKEEEKSEETDLGGTGNLEAHVVFGDASGTFFSEQSPATAFEDT